MRILVHDFEESLWEMDKRRDRALKKVSARAESHCVLRTTRQKTSTIQAVPQKT